MPWATRESCGDLALSLRVAAEGGTDEENSSSLIIFSWMLGRLRGGVRGEGVQREGGNGGAQEGKKPFLISLGAHRIHAVRGIAVESLVLCTMCTQ